MQDIHSRLNTLNFTRAFFEWCQPALTVTTEAEFWSLCSLLCQCSIDANLDESGRVMGSLFALFTCRFKKSQACVAQSAMLCKRLLQFLPIMLESYLPNTQFVIDCHNYIVRNVAMKRGADRAFFEEVKPLIKQLPSILRSRIVMNFPPQLLETVELIPAPDTDASVVSGSIRPDGAPPENENDAQEGDDVIDVVIQTLSGR
jgi:hypothetical protein